MEINFGEKKEFVLVKEGQRRLTITNVEFKPEGKPTDAYFTFEDKVDGGIISTKYSFDNREKSNQILGVLVSMVANDGKWVSKIDTNDLLNMKGVTLLCDVVHNPGKKPREDGTYPTFANIKRFVSVETLSDVNVDDLF